MKLKTYEIKNMSLIERQKKLEDLRSELFKIRSSDAMGGTLTDPAKIRMLKRSIARILTIMKQDNEI